MIILDTNVLSELMKPTPSARVVAWAQKQSASELFTTAITEAEIFYGIEMLGKGKRREGLLAAAQAMFTEDVSSVLRVTRRGIFRGLPRIAAFWANLSAMRTRRSPPSPECTEPN